MLSNQSFFIKKIFEFIFYFLMDVIRDLKVLHTTVLVNFIKETALIPVDLASDLTYVLHAICLDELDLLRSAFQ